MIQKILIANRGAIASRIIRTCRQLHIKSVALFSEADRDMPYVNMADEAYFLGPSPAHESYMHVDRIIDIAKDAEVDAIHPGYGFLSEDADFAKRCHEAGIRFIGPSFKVLNKVSHKQRAKELVKKAGVPVIPGATVEDLEDAKKIAQKIQYPVILKIPSGGGGIGMVSVASADGLSQAFLNLQKRAQRMFGSDAILIEKQLHHAKHIEVQIMADVHGNMIHLFERECSIQRRYQKVIEEAPAVYIRDNTRKKLHDLALQVVKTMQYTNVGTVEFLVDHDENIYFLEINPRIQVEHGVTEEITNIDLVAEQINITSGHSLAIKQADVQIEGHAIEVRLYAEDPQTFFPSPGTIQQLDIPDKFYLRKELGVEANNVITPFYDPMFGKLIVKGSSRQETIGRLKEVLEEVMIEGIQTNVPILEQMISDERFKQGKIYSDFLETTFMKSAAK